MMSWVKEANGERPETPIREIAAEFNRRFSANRTVTGLQSLLDRMRNEFKAYSGLRERQDRGHMQRMKSNASRGAGNFEGPAKDEGPSKHEEPAEGSEGSEFGGDDDDDK